MISGKTAESKTYIFESMPVPQALFTMGVPTVISQLINLAYNVVDAFFIGRTGSSYMMAATTLVLTLTMMVVAISNLFGVGGGSLYARLLGTHQEEEAGRVSAFSVYGAIAVAALYSALVGIFMDRLLRALGASDATIGYARQYTWIVIVAGTIPALLSLVLANLLRNAGYAGKASIGLSSGGILNMALDPLFMFVLLPKGCEVMGAAIATLISNILACGFLLMAYRNASRKEALSMRFRDASGISGKSVKTIFEVGVPAALLTGLYDLANIFTNKLAAGHSDFVLAGMGIVMKMERIPNAINIGICQGMMPIVSYNYASGNHERMKKTISGARTAGLVITAMSIILYETLAVPLTSVFLNTGGNDALSTMTTLGYAALFLRIRCLAAPVQLMNYHGSFCMQAMGNGKGTLAHAFVREMVFYTFFVFLLDHLFAERGLACALIAGEACGTVFVSWLLQRTIRSAKAAEVQKA